MQLTHLIANGLRRLGAFSVAVMGALALLLFTHIVMCPPTLDDDVCAAARIDHAVHCTLEKAAHVAKPDGDLPTLLAPEPVQHVAVLFAAILALPQPASAHLLREARAPDRSSALAHKRTVVLLT